MPKRGPGKPSGGQSSGLEELGKRSTNVLDGAGVLAKRSLGSGPLLLVSCADPLNYVGSVAITGLVVDAVNFALQPGSSKAGRYLLDFPSYKRPARFCGLPRLGRLVAGLAARGGAGPLLCLQEKPDVLCKQETDISSVSCGRRAAYILCWGAL